MPTKSVSITVLIALSLFLVACGQGPLSLAAQSNQSPAATAPPSGGTVAPRDTTTPPPDSGAPSSTASGGVAAAGSVAELEQTLEQIYERVNPSVVAIDVAVNSPAAFDAPTDHPDVPFARALGSGFVWDTAGHIVTNYHVVANAANVSITFYDGTLAAATVVGVDPDSDLAVLKVDLPADQLQPITLGDSTQVKVGQLAIAIGNPFGNQNTMTVGFISALARSLPVGVDTALGGTYTIPDIIQTDAPINPGNSGGVLLDDQGQVLGVTAAIDTQSDSGSGVGFAIPSVIVGKVVPELITSGHFEHPWLGLSGRTLFPDLADAMDLPVDQRGVLVGTVTAGSPAEQAGLQGSTTDATVNGQSANVGGDVITAIDDQPVQTFDDLVSYLARSTEVEQTVTLTVLRDGETRTIDLTLAARPQADSQTSQAAPNSPTPPATTAGPWLGVVGLSMSPELAAALNLARDQPGVLVVQVQPNSPADRAGLQGGSQLVELNGLEIPIGGDLITAVDGFPIYDLPELQLALQRAGINQAVILTILRNGQEQEVSLTLTARPAAQ